MERLGIMRRPCLTVGAANRTKKCRVVWDRVQSGALRTLGLNAKLFAKPKAAVKGNEEIETKD